MTKYKDLSCENCTGDKLCHCEKEKTRRVVDWTKPIQTRDGKPALYIRPINGRNHSRLVIVTYPEHEQPLCYTESGGFFGNDDTREYELDIINVPPKMRTLSGHVTLLKGKDGKWRPVYDDILISKDRLDSTTNCYDRYEQEYKILPISFEVPDES